MIAISRGLVSFLSPSLYVVVLHHLSYPLFAYSNIAPTQFALHARPAIGILGFGMDRPDVSQQCHVAHPPATIGRWVASSLSMQVLLKTTDADLQNIALYRDRPLISVSLNKGVLYSDSLAKYAVAFFSMSRFIFTRANSERIRRISICSELTSDFA